MCLTAHRSIHAAMHRAAALHRWSPSDVDSPAVHPAQSVGGADACEADECAVPRERHRPLGVSGDEGDGLVAAGQGPRFGANMHTELFDLETILGDAARAFDELAPFNAPNPRHPPLTTLEQLHILADQPPPLPETLPNLLRLSNPLPHVQVPGSQAMQSLDSGMEMLPCTHGSSSVAAGGASTRPSTVAHSTLRPSTHGSGQGSFGKGFGSGSLSGGKGAVSVPKKGKPPLSSIFDAAPCNCTSSTGTRTTFDLKEDSPLTGSRGGNHRYGHGHGSKQLASQSDVDGLLGEPCS